MALVSVEASSPSARERAEELAQFFKVPFLDKTPEESGGGVKLVVDGNGVALGFVDPRRGKPHLIDFQSQIWRERFKKPLPKHHIFRRALGVRDQTISFWDATAGFGQDAMLALSLGCQVTAIEQSPVVALLLSDALKRAQVDDEDWRLRLKNFALRIGDSAQLLRELTPGEAPDVVYLDPMFDKPKKNAKSPKEMQLLQELIDQSPNLLEQKNLFEIALLKARQRVVVKTPLKGRSLQEKPSHSLRGQSIRYDVWVK